MLISPRRLLVITVNASLMSDRRPNLYLAPSPVLPSRPESAKKDSNEKCAGNNPGDMKRREKNELRGKSADQLLHFLTEIHGALAASVS